MPRHPQTITLEAWQGLDNKRPEQRIAQDFLAEATNIDIGSDGEIRLRQGYTKVISGTNAHSLWSDGDKEAFYVDEGVLYRIDPFNTSTTTSLGSGFDDTKLSYHAIGSRIYSSGGNVNVVIENNEMRPWGIKSPSIAPLHTIISGQLKAGDYQVAYRYVTSDGRVSGPSGRTQITLSTDDSGIHLFGLGTSSDPTVVGYELFVSTTYGEVLYSVGSTSSTTYDIIDLYGDMVPLDFRFMDVPPSCSLIESYNGRIYMAVNDYLWYTEPHNYEMCHLGENWIKFPGDITNIMPVDDGIFITADRLYFLEGNGPDLFRQREREIYKAAKYTAVKIIGGDVIMENIPTGLKWLFTSDKGMVMVGTGGLVFNLTERNVMIDSAESGAAIFRSDEGMNQYISILKNPASNNRLRFGDTVTATVIRNGVVIN